MYGFLLVGTAILMMVAEEETTGKCNGRGRNSNATRRRGDVQIFVRADLQIAHAVILLLVIFKF